MEWSYEERIILYIGTDIKLLGDYNVLAKYARQDNIAIINGRWYSD